MLDYEEGTFVALDVPFVPAASGSGICLLQEEDCQDAYLVLGGYSPDMSTSATALLTATGIVQSVFGYPNEEAYFHDPRGPLSHGIYEVQGSRWLRNVAEYNVRTFGEYHRTRALGSRHPSKASQADSYFRVPLRHFFIGSKDVSAQVLSFDLQPEIFTDIPFRAVFHEATRRLGHPNTGG